MEWLFRSGHVADLLLLVLALETAWLASGRGPVSAKAALPFLAAGACFALALRGALTGAAWPWIAAPLAAAGLAHLWDLWSRGR